ncbi:putative membrane protein [Litoreibacter halocynthiae]|uniref:Putative membrane protein n=1 Tax=Litoreibacter halocynthiae TaxID=1242689 RepID=A0A4R7LN45_9RHOB|nr:anthrone oxygenase family protein [Litoreibacter halocynthiae]TDT77448.1 putative membrane protein [Litoreibacter halocynthiae]
MQQSAKSFAVISTVFAGAIFGFFYAWVCSTMWGLDTLDPRTAISAMNAMNGSVRNAVFAPAFFGTPVVLALTALALKLAGKGSASLWFGVAATVSLVFGTLLTMAVNVPMNEALALVDIPDDRAAAQVIWEGYSPKWQFWNQARTVASGVALLFACIGLTKIGKAA